MNQTMQMGMGVQSFQNNNKNPLFHAIYKFMNEIDWIKRNRFANSDVFLLSFYVQCSMCTMCTLLIRPKIKTTRFIYFIFFIHFVNDRVDDNDQHYSIFSSLLDASLNLKTIFNNISNCGWRMEKSHNLKYLNQNSYSITVVRQPAQSPICLIMIHHFVLCVLLIMIL